MAKRMFSRISLFRSHNHLRISARDRSKKQLQKLLTAGGEDASSSFKDKFRPDDQSSNFDGPATPISGDAPDFSGDFNN
jgi:hypothetical protein